MASNGLYSRALFLAVAATTFLCSRSQAAVVYWTDWQTSSGVGGFTAQGTITTPTASVGVTYNNPAGIAFYQSSGGTDYWRQGPSGSLGRNPATSPYTSTQVDNIPTGTDMIALRYVGNQTLTFSEAIANPVFSYVSLNFNGYAFLNQDFDILSFGGVGGGDNDIGHWGAGTSYKNVVDLGDGNFEYQLLGTGEPHGTIQFKGAFDTLQWRSLSSEFWNGFTVGVQGTAAEVFVPEPMTLAMWLGIGAASAAAGYRRRRAAA